MALQRVFPLAVHASIAHSPFLFVWAPALFTFPAFSPSHSVQVSAGINQPGANWLLAPAVLQLSTSRGRKPQPGKAGTSHDALT